MFFFLVAPLNPAFAAQPIKVTVDGFKLDFDVSPILENGRVLVPLRAIFEELGAFKTETLNVIEYSPYITISSEDEKILKIELPAFKGSMKLKIDYGNDKRTISTRTNIGLNCFCCAGVI